MPLFAARISPLRIGLGVLVAVWLFLAASAARAQEDPVAIEKITTLNKKALDAYNNLDFEDARKLLKQALDLCSSSGLDKHPIKARTHIHMGVVLIATKQQDLGVKQFRKALEIQSDIQVTKALANPEILQAFEEARAGSAAGGGGADTGSGDAGGGDAGGTQEAPPGISHFPVTRGKKGRPIAISVTVSPNLTGYAKVVLAYRAEGAEEFLARDMRRAGNRFVGEIPADATDGNLVQYYVDAEAEDETAVASAGSEERPFVVSLGGGGGDDDEEDDEDDDGRKFWVSVLGGSGIGYATGNGEVNADNKVNAGFAPSSAVQLVPEVGYFVTPAFRISLQFRYQIVSGTTPLNLKSVQAARAAQTPPGPPIDINKCGPDMLCSTATGAAAVILRGSWFFGSDTFRPYFSLAAGAGQIRHVVKFTSLMANMKGLCGTSGDQPCYDTVLSGPIFAGPGGGLMIAITPMFSAVIDVGTLLGFPKFTFHIDGNAGIAARF